jgi:putative tricarboxylic transport membrane protein
VTTPQAGHADRVPGGTRRGWEIGITLAFLAVGIVAVAESFRLGAGYTISGPESGFFPLWTAVPLLICASVCLWQARRIPADRPIFDDRDEAAEFVKVGVPLAVSLIALPWTGFYLATAAYVGFFSAWYGRYRWWIVVAATILSPLVFYLVFERGFVVPLPKSIFYRPGIPF